MRLFDLLRLAFKNIIRKKSYIFIVLLISISALSVIFGLSFKNSFNNYWNNYVEKNIDFRIFSVSYEKIKDDIINNVDIDKLSASEKIELFDKAAAMTEKILLSIPHIDGVTRADGYIVDIDNIEYNGNNIAESLYLIGVPSNTYIDIVNGMSLDKFNPNDKVMICSNNLQSNYNDSESMIYDTNSILNEDIKIKFFDGSLEYKIVGVYDKISTYAIGNSCYTSYENVKEILSEVYKKDVEINSQSEGYYGEPLYIMIDDRSNLEELENELLKYDLFLEPIITIDTSILHQVTKVCSYISVFTFLFTIIIVLFNILINIKENNKIFYVYNVVGYSKWKIMLINICENAFLGIISFVLSIFLSIIAFKAFKYVVLSHNTRLYLFSQHFDTQCLLVGSIIAFVLPILVCIVFIINSKFVKNNVLE